MIGNAGNSAAAAGWRMGGHSAGRRGRHGPWQGGWHDRTGPRRPCRRCRAHQAGWYKNPPSNLSLEWQLRCTLKQPEGALQFKVAAELAAGPSAACQWRVCGRGTGRTVRPSCCQCPLRPPGRPAARPSHGGIDSGLGPPPPPPGLCNQDANSDSDISADSTCPPGARARAVPLSLRAPDLRA